MEAPDRLGRHSSPLKHVRIRRDKAVASDAPDIIIAPPTQFLGFTLKIIGYFTEFHDVEERLIRRSGRQPLTMIGIPDDEFLAGGSEPKTGPRPIVVAPQVFLGFP